MKTWILSQWYREEDRFEAWYYELWRRALARYAPGVPILMVHNGGPTDPPYDDVEVVPAVEMVPHERHEFGHYFNCWRSMAHGYELLAERGAELGIFIGQNLIVGAEFARECEEAVEGAELLLNVGCLFDHWAYTEYMAARPAACAELWKKRLVDDGQMAVEGAILDWSRELGLRHAPFPVLRKPRDQPLGPDDTFCFHCQPWEVRSFAEARSLL